jgi:hypothetical protein
MSATSSRDSIAMKALAFITTLFLPGTFVAVRHHSLRSSLTQILSSYPDAPQTVFSMNMFDWQASTPDSAQTVSSMFWIYWVITVPLTLIVAFSWRLWWKWEKKNFDRDVRIEIENIEETNSWKTNDSLPMKGDESATLVQDLRKGWQGLHRRNR